MKYSAVILLLTLFSIELVSQELTQTIRGRVIDQDSQETLIGASVILLGADPIKGTVTDVEGRFRLEDVPIGRRSLQIGFVGYERMTIPNIEVISAKEVVLTIALRESITTMEEVVIRATREKGEALNEMALVSVRSISAEETEKYAGGFSDPSRIVTAFAGVGTGNDGDNDIIVRGNSPKYVQWRLEGMEIANPTHFADQNAVRGGMSLLNNNLLATSDFHTGAFSPEFGNALSGVYDVRLRNGNNERMEASFGFGLLGTDILLEGPIKGGHAGSYLVNYRYSTAGLAGDLGLIEVDGPLDFQDATFKLHLPTKGLGVFSLFGLAGLSGFEVADVEPTLLITPGETPLTEGLREDYRKRSDRIDLGLSHRMPISTDSHLRTILSTSIAALDEDVIDSRYRNFYDDEGAIVRDSLLGRAQNFKSRLLRSTYQASLTYNNKLDVKNRIQIGSRIALEDYAFTQSRLSGEESARTTIVDIDEQVGRLHNFISWKHRFSEDITMVAGVHNTLVLFNDKSTIEPRLAMDWRLDRRNALHAGYGKHSSMESIHNYFAKVQRSGGAVTEPNHDLDLLKAHHFVLGYTRRLSENMRATVELYYQYLYDLPVENVDTSIYATINENTDFRYVELVNEGKGRNYGVELTIERFLDRNYYFMVNGSLFASKYTALDRIERNTRYSGDYLVNLLAGKEFIGWGRKENQTLSVNAKVFFGGGKKQILLLRTAEGKLAVDPENDRYYDYDNAYENSLDDIYTIILSTSYKWDKPKATHELYINLDNLSSSTARLSEYYDEEEPGSVAYVKQFGLFPNLMYRVHF